MNAINLACLSVAVLWFGGEFCAAQNPAAAVPPHVIGGNPPAAREPERKFNLDFPGGTPQQLVEAIEKATGEPLNAIIHEQDKDVVLPALKMRQVTVADLFTAMEQASRRTETQITGTYFSNFSGGTPHSQYTTMETSAGFRKVGTVWIFTNKRAVPPPDTVLVKTRFYQLDPYLAGHTIEDITTAIQTAWKMMAENKMSRNRNSATELKFHKETGLLIAVGDAAQVQVIDDVLNALRPDLAAGLKPAEPPRKTNAPAKIPTIGN